MSQGRGQFVCGAIFGIALGFAVGHLIVRTRTSGDAVSLAGGLVPTPTDVDPDGGRLSTPRARLAQRDPDGRGGSVFDRYPAGGADVPRPARSIITADAFRKDDLASDSPSGPSGPSSPAGQPGPTQQEPSPLPRVEALPIPPDSRPDEATATREVPEELQSLLKDELQSASPEQNEAWKDALDGVPSGDAAEILRMWKSIGARPAPGGVLSAPSPVQPLPPSPFYVAGTGPSFPPIPPSPWPTDSYLPSPDFATAGRLRRSHPKVWRQLQCDLAHAETPGYRGSIPELADADDGPASPTFRVAALRTDFAPGKLVPTGSMFDVGLTGNGFFSITTGQGTALTRLGRLGLDAERRLGVRLGVSVAPLKPEIRIPAEAEGVAIAADGSVSLVAEGVVSPSPLGRIAPVQVLDPSQLVAAEGQAGIAFAQTPQSGSPHNVPASAFSLQQYAVEGSNVDAEVTRRWIIRLEALAAEGALPGE